MKKFSLFLGLTLLVATWGVLPCAAQDTIQVGIVLPLTGEQAKFGEIEKLSFDLALEEINAKGGINGKKLEFVIEDDTGRPEVGRSVVEKLITKDKVGDDRRRVQQLGHLRRGRRLPAEPDPLPGEHRFGRQHHPVQLGLRLPARIHP